MKTAVYFEDGIAQIVLTPTNKFERQLIKNLQYGPMETSATHGEFYLNRGGYMMNDMASPTSPNYEQKSLIIVIEPSKNKKETS